MDRGSGCKNCPVQHCTTMNYRGSTCAAQRAKFGLGDPMTNLDRFRAMDEKEIARFLMAAHDCEVHIPFCKNKEKCCDDLDSITPVQCIVCMMEWLNKPMEEELWQS